MHEPPTPRSALAGLNLWRQTQAFAEAQAHATHRTFTTMVAVRGRASEPGFLSAFRGMLGVEPPAAVGDVARSERYTLLCLGPDRWLVIAEPGLGGELAQKLDLAFLGIHAAAVDLSSACTTVRLSGPAARTLIETGCALDLHPRSFPVDRCLSTRVGNAQVVIDHLVDGTYDLHVPRSAAVSFWAWLEHAGREFRIVVTAG